MDTAVGSLIAIVGIAAALWFDFRWLFGLSPNIEVLESFLARKLKARLRWG